MRKIFVIFVALFAYMATATQANTNDTIVAGKVSYQATYGGKILHIQKDSTAVIVGVDSIVTIKTDTATNSEKVVIYANGKKFNQWVRPGYTSILDPSDTTGQQIIVYAMGGDEDESSSPKDALPIGWLLAIIAVSMVGGFKILRICKII